MATEAGLEASLLPWYEESFDNLPVQLQRLVTTKFPPVSWEDLSPDQRRLRAMAIDHQESPEFSEQVDFWLNLYSDLVEKEQQIGELSSLSGNSPSEVLAKQKALAELTAQTSEIRNKIRSAPKPPPLQSERRVPDAGKLIPFKKTMYILKKTHGASAEELAAWVHLGRENGGVSAYRCVKEVRRFHFQPEMDTDYIMHLLDCDFEEEVITAFIPDDRYITGRELLDALSVEFGSLARKYLMAMSADGTLMDLHPITGGTDNGLRDNLGFPPMEDALFSVAEIQKVSKARGWNFLLPERISAALKAKETPAERKARLHKWFDEEVKLRGARGATTRTASREGIKYQTLKAILKRDC
ncbi:MAG: hypothetical protein KDE20_12305 [Caldilineaceae bacterium]|nr:hypothetical protein [Caldilineaceae bacterium]